MNLGNILGKAQNFFQKAKSKEGEIKGFIQGLKNKGGNPDFSNDETFKRTTVVDDTTLTQEEPKKPNYMIFAVVGVVVLYMLMKKK
jgi:hypothetical protein